MCLMVSYVWLMLLWPHMYTGYEPLKYTEIMTDVHLPRSCQAIHLKMA